MTVPEESAIRDITIGALIVVIGLISGKSIFFGHFGLLSAFLDLIGLFWLIGGLRKYYLAKRGRSQENGNTD